MGEVVRLDQARWQRLARGGYARWQSLVGWRPAPESRLADAPDAALARLAELGPQATMALNDLVGAALGLGAAEDMEKLPPAEKMEALDAYLFLVDQVRFEMMRRLGWVEGLAADKHSLAELAVDHADIKAREQQRPPMLKPSHHRYTELQSRLEREPEAAIRSLIPEALTLFRRRLGL